MENKEKLNSNDAIKQLRYEITDRIILAKETNDEEAWESINRDLKKIDKLKKTNSNDAINQLRYEIKDRIKLAKETNDEEAWESINRDIEKIDKLQIDKWEEEKENFNSLDNSDKYKLHLKLGQTIESLVLSGMMNAVRNEDVLEMFDKIEDIKKDYYFPPFWSTVDSYKEAILNNVVDFSDPENIAKRQKHKLLPKNKKHKM